MKCGWHVPVVLESWEAEWLDPRNLRSAWATHLVKGNLKTDDFISVLHVSISLYC